MGELSRARKRTAAYGFLSKAFLGEMPLSFWEALSREVSLQGPSSQGVLLQGSSSRGSSSQKAFSRETFSQEALLQGNFSSGCFAEEGASLCAFVRVLADDVVCLGAERAYLDAAADCAALLWGMSAYSMHPYESVHRGPVGVMMQDARDAVLAVYRAAGVRPHALAGNIPEDHLGIELAFMGVLCNREAEGLTQGNARQAEGTRAMQRAFLEEHLLAWVPDLCADLMHRAQKRAACGTTDVREDDRLPLYAALAQATSEFLACEQTVMCDEGCLFGGD